MSSVRKQLINTMLSNPEKLPRIIQHTEKKKLKPQEIRQKQYEESQTNINLLHLFTKLTRTELPKAAREYNWPIKQEKDFIRVIMDNICGKIWVEVIKGPIRQKATNIQLQKACDLMLECLGHPNLLIICNKFSEKVRQDAKNTSV